MTIMPANRAYTRLMTLSARLSRQISFVESPVVKVEFESSRNPA